MSLGFGVTDIVTATKLAWDLYSKCIVVAHRAPEGFRSLLDELGGLKSILHSIREDIKADSTFVEKLGEHRKEALERCLSGCLETFRRLQELVGKYQALGSADNPNIWKKIKWVTEQSTIADLKTRIAAHTSSINLCIASIGNSSLSRIESRLRETAEQRGRAPDLVEDVDESDELAPLNRHQYTSPPSSSGFSQGAPMERAFTESTLYEPVNMRTELTPSPSSEGASEIDPSKTHIINPYHKMSPGMDFRTRPTKNFKYDNRALPLSPKGSDEYSMTNHKSEDLQNRFPDYEESPEPANHDLLAGSPESMKRMDEEAVADAKWQLSTINQREPISRPLRVVSQDPERRPPPALCTVFQKSADDELEFRRIDAKDWLRVATWWLLKARNNMRTGEQPEIISSRGSLSVPGDGRSPANQAYVDLLKASWILHMVILREDHTTALTTDENRKLYQDLSDGIKEEFNMYQPVDTPEKDTFLKQNCDLWEHLQPEEEKFDDENFLLGMENGRWITLEQDDAGDESEKVLFRTFVNAAIGSRKVRSKSKGAPYLLILSTKDGESEPVVTLCNQSGTLCLTRVFTIEDLQEDPVSPSLYAGAPQLIAAEAIPFTFGKTSTVISFPNYLDLQRFMRIPQVYFDAVKRREPRRLEKATESLLFGRSVETYERLNPSTLKPLEPPERFPSCNLRMLETTNQEAWRTTRRLVVSSSAAQKRPWLVESFLPLSGIQIQREPLSRQMLIKWSDCCNETEKTDGNYNKVWSYVYDEGNPNVALRLSFRHADEAAEFERSALQLSSTPVFSWSTSLVSGFVHTVSDTDPHPRDYKALWFIRSRYQWKFSQVFFMYRDTDYVYEHASTHVRFPQALYPHYISSHVDRLFRPAINEAPQFLECARRHGNVLAEFANESDCMALMSSLSSQHTLVFSRRAPHLMTKAPSRFGSAKSNKGQAEVQVWRKGNSILLLSRWGDHVEDKWISMTVPKNGPDYQRDSNRATFPKLEYDRGRKVDMANLMARDPREKMEKGRFGCITIVFDTVRDREEFVGALEGNIPYQPRSALDDLMTI